MNTEQESKNLPLEASAFVDAKKFKGTSTLRNRLLTSVLPVVLLPLLVASAIGYKLTESRAEDRIRERLKADTVLAEEAVTFFIEDSFAVMDLISANPQVIEAIKTGNDIVDEQNLAQQPIESLEEQFAQTKLLKPNASLNSYLRQAVESSRAAEIHFSERNGFNVGYSNETSDFVQSDEDWWKIAKAEGSSIDEAEYDESADTTVLAISKAIQDPATGEFLGVIKTGMSIDELKTALNTYLTFDDTVIETSQVVDLHNGFVIATIDHHALQTGDSSAMVQEEAEIVGGEAVLQVARTLKDVEKVALSVEEAQQLVSEQSGFSEVKLEQKDVSNQTITSAVFAYQNKLYSLSTVSGTEIASISVVDSEVVAQEGQALLATFATTGLILSAVAVGVIILIAQQIAKPITNLSALTQQAAIGNFDIRADVEGSLETQTLADNFNYLISQTKDSLENQKALTEAQRQEKEQLELAIYTLIDEIGDATDGDLTVRANLDSLELSTVADLFNAIIDNLQQIAIEAKQSSNLVGSSLKQNEQAIRTLAEQATTEAEQTRNTLQSVAQMSESIQTVATNANQAEKIAGDTYNTVLNSTSNMDSTVDSILNLRTTVSDTANKMQRLAESSQKISQAVSLIEEITLKTNVLAINAGAEADRAGEYGQGFSVVAEQVGALAEQSKAAVKEIASIVSGIQAETQEVKQAMESGTAQVLNTTRLVENTKQSLAEVLEKSQTINQLMESISQSTVSQADTSQNLTSLMQRIAKLSATTSKSSTEVAQSMGETAQVAQKLESAVSQFKVAK